jgi:hypothetical protein
MIVNISIRKPLGYLASLFACIVMSTAITGCASGGYKLTRQFAGWLNSQNLILRVILYLLTGIVFGVTLLIDWVVFNTMDFWQGRVSSGTYEKTEGDKTYLAKHEILPGQNLKRSTLTVKDKNFKVVKEVKIIELASGEIELYIDGTLKTRVSNISWLPVAKIFDSKGQVTDEKMLFTETMLISAK